MIGYASRIERAVRSFGNQLVDRFPSVRGHFVWLWERYVLTYAYLVCWRDSLLYARRTTLSPFEVVEVDPDRIEYLVEPDGYPIQTHVEPAFSGSKFKHAGTVRGGDWDTRGMRFEETDHYRAFEAHFERGVAWEETTFYDRAVEFIDDGISLWGCTSEADLERRFAALDVLYETIRENGLYSQEEFARASVEDPMADDRRSVISRRIYDEMTVCIGRDGDLLFWDGRNRLAIAKVLDLDAIPVWIMVRHTQWQSYREKVAAIPSSCRELPDRMRSHPDIRAILDRKTGG